jgi:hypothetical protein
MIINGTDFENENGIAHFINDPNQSTLVGKDLWINRGKKCWQSKSPDKEGFYPGSRLY